MFQPIANYQNLEHVLNAINTSMHPNGNHYGIVIEKYGGVRQDLAVYRTRAGQTQKELVRRYIGGADSRAQFAAGGCQILPDGSLEVWASAVPLIGAVTRTGFSGLWDRVPNVDVSWSAGAGGTTLFPAPLTNPAWEGRVMAANTGELVDIPATFGAPVASVYIVRFVVVADGPNIRARAGTQQSPFFLTCNTVAAGIESHLQGLVPGKHTYISSAQGAIKFWFQILGTG